ncbi:unnamed protein product [Phytomonas sp. EM1]|nr:unnamed protein product [Phytomonas sp. EM1]|eukprot:CCW63231.1 unnamed protein product [Phytomonas sp. isolate EM1]
MKGIVGSSQGSSKYRSGRGRGGAQAGKSAHRDERFASRFTDPRFKLSSKLHKKHKQRYSPRDKLEKAASRDPRFAKNFNPSEETQSKYEEDNLTDTDEEDTPTKKNLVADVDDFEENSSDENDDEVDDVCEWAPEDVELTEATHRIAVVNCDWDHVRAVDLYAILFHALPLGGQLKDVCVYMSDFGKKMLEHERVHGPDLWVKEGEEDVDVNQDLPHDGIESAHEYDDNMEEGEQTDSEGSDDDNGWVDDNPSMFTERGEDGEYFSGGKYRQYEMNRMKYYYAIATFDSPETAAAVYRELDGTDIESSGVVLDLRYVDEDETFKDPVSRANGIPPNFKPLSSFKAAALSQARFRISWDQDDLFRHRSVQDAFTGTTAEDDLAAYLAPPDSDDDEKDARTGRTKAEEKLRLQHKYAALLAEIGKVPGQLDEDDNQVGDGTDETREEQGANGFSSDSSVDGDTTDDDSLNRFSDVDSEDEAESGSNDAESEVMGDMEATLDLDADNKAVGLQREARLRKMKKESSLGAQAELKYKLRRKAMKKTKKEELLHEREMEVEASLAEKKERTEKLKALIGSNDNGAIRLSGKERRKRHVKEVKETLAKERAAKKQSRIVSQMGITREARVRLDTQEAEQAKGAIDSRFQSKLLSDPRYHLEIAQKDKRVSKDVAELAATVAKARRGKRAHEDDKDATAGGEDAKPLDSVVDYFLEAPSRKKKK